MSTYTIRGGKPLSGTLAVSGSVNAALPIICASLLAGEPCTLENIPDISDVHHLLAIVEDLGAKVDYVAATHHLTVDPRTISKSIPNPELVKKLRGSILLIGPLLSRAGSVTVPYPGGDLIGKRPIDTHLLALQELGAQVREGDVLQISAPAGGLRGADVILNEMSVTATENAVMAAACASGDTSIHLAATEPHVQDLCRFLNAIGAKIENIGQHDLLVHGVPIASLHGASYAVIYDNEVTASYANLAAAARCEMFIQHAQPQFMYGASIQWKLMGVNFEVQPDGILVKKPTGPYRAAKIKTSVYPGLMTDYIPPFVVLATQAEGTSQVHEWMYEGRLGYIHELSKMGANCRILDQHRAEVTGATQLHGTNVSSLDVRSGMVMIIAALIADGKSVLHDVEHVERKYENILGILKQAGADIERGEE